VVTPGVDFDNAGIIPLRYPFPRPLRVFRCAAMSRRSRHYLNFLQILLCGAMRNRSWWPSCGIEPPTRDFQSRVYTELPGAEARRTAGLIKAGA